ncbi:glycoside hydrolase family 2 TIM barrel-domain containing protein [Thalassobellus suaedae]|uniref:Glycoside hydrolase family 2 TIM barrel-domain containing protein n=1 Tax=Thalassobellus suaedae TaxID=3074124 RepID=A0ABY9XP05_9FLAO|nr:glycoside hydrolase family 2 TIM barrel-domain containing protein [Flavobacteriaceae bacterium HL-DH14]
MRDRKHPSVIMWSIGNEVDYPNDPYTHPILAEEGISQQSVKAYLEDHPSAERLGDIAKELVAAVKEADNSRPVTAALAGAVMSNYTEYPFVLDIVGYNYTEYKYDSDHELYPERVLYGSENRHDLGAWKAVKDKEFIFGQFLWTGVDYLGEAHAWYFQRIYIRFTRFGGKH